VVQAGAIGEPGEVMVLDMGEPVKILEIAQRLINALDPAATIEFTGLRPGEKLHEVLLSDDEVEHRRVHPRITHTRPTINGAPDAAAAESAAAATAVE
ncbi:MAG: polysaccharide biosynthesis protein, partial [Acidimicrobiia bacterium]|nr:polysaccharide biosynthesis protein [Acidimicrobiia bacterium]